VWLKVAEDIHLPSGELVGFFAPGVLAEAEGAGKKGRAFALMRDGAVLPMPFTTRALAERLARAGHDNNKAMTGEQWKKQKSRR